MVKRWYIAMLCMTVLQAQSTYEYYCVSCHQGMTIGLDKFFMRYLIKYSSEEEVKKALFVYMKSPKAETSILEPWLIQRIGVKKRSTLNDAALREAIDDYWKEHKVFGKLK